MTTGQVVNCQQSSKLATFSSADTFHTFVWVQICLCASICMERWCFASLNNYNNAGWRLYTGGGVALALFTLALSLCTFNNDSEYAGHYQANAGENSKIVNAN